MIKIRDFKAYFDALAERVNATKCVLVRSEPELVQKIKSIDAGELFLVAVIPSSDTTARDADNIREKEQVILYAVMKVTRKNQDDASMLDDMELTQDCITNIKMALFDDAENHESQYHSLLKYIDFNSLHTDPEYNYCECDGYSLSLTLTTPGF